MRLAVPRGPNDPPVYIDVACFATLADTCARQLGKGHQIAVQGRLDYVEWTADDGAKRSKHEVIASRVDFLARPAGERPSDAGAEHDPAPDAPTSEGRQGRGVKAIPF